MRMAFWNTNRNVEINPYVQDIIIDNGIDIMVLAEYEANINHLRNGLRKHNIYMGKYISIGCDRITLLGKCRNVNPCYQDTYCSLQNIQDKYILVCVHFPSKTHCERKKKDIVIRRVIQEIQKLEEESACQNTIVVGDFNENPYEGGCLAADGFHGLPDYYVAQREHRKILGEEFKMFYNPMWNLFGDFSSPPGTFFYNGNDVENPF